MDKSEWMDGIRKHQFPWMNDAQFECYQMFCDLLGGANHQFGKVKAISDTGIVITELASGSNWATYDYNLLTRAVVMAHDRCIRFSMGPCSHIHLRFYLQKRDRNSGSISCRHPTLEESLAAIRDSDRGSKE